jgi:hypothetical protein
MDTTSRDCFDPIARVTPLMIHGTDLEILESDLSILNNRRPASRDWCVGSFTFTNWLAAPVAIPSERERPNQVSWTLYPALGGNRAAPVPKGGVRNEAAPHSHS